MPPDQQSPDKPRGTVGVYDRPASADRKPILPIVIAVVVSGAIGVASWLMFWPQ